jgi:hypothetical protein
MPQKPPTLQGAAGSRKVGSKAMTELRTEIRDGLLYVEGGDTFTPVHPILHSVLIEVSGLAIEDHWRGPDLLDDNGHGASHWSSIRGVGSLVDMEFVLLKSQKTSFRKFTVNVHSIDENLFGSAKWQEDAKKSWPAYVLQMFSSSMMQTFQFI